LNKKAETILLAKFSVYKKNNACNIVNKQILPVSISAKKLYFPFLIFQKFHKM